jgi:hypothetical protein
LSIVFLLISGAVLLGIGGILDSLFRSRMMRLGHKWALLQGGAFNYKEYHQARKRQGWAAWPVYVMWSAFLCGIALLIAGFFTYFGVRRTG